MKRTKNNIYRQALLAALVVFLTVIILFAITAAWYTNIAQTGGLVFEAETWGFQGEVNLGSTENIKAAPGDEGIIALTAKNTGATTAAVGVNVNKAKMDSEMQKRIYFYVDAPKTINGETVDRVYLNSSMNYAYTLFGGEELKLTEDVNNNALLKWHWVYDVLGYYVQGTFSTTTNSVVVSEYLRPIEYDFDEANTTFEVVPLEDGTKNYAGLSTIDGETTVAEFIAEFSKHDGYEGTIDTSKVTADGYYPVDVDKNGRGVWAYMCSYTDIFMNTQYDTKLGEDAAKAASPATYEATITLSAQNTDVETTTVDSATALLTAIENAKTTGETAYIKLSSSVNLNSAMALESKEQVVIDLNGNTLTVPMGTYAEHNAGIQLSEGSSLSLYNGTLSGGTETSSGIAVYTQGAELNMNGVTVNNVECGVYVRDDWSELGADSRIRIIGSVLNCSEEGIYLSGNGADSARATQLVVENSTITSGYIGIMGNGNDTQWGTDVQIINSVVSGTWGGIYQPQRNSTLTVSGANTQINGNNAIVLKGGAAVIYDGAIVGTGAKAAGAPTGMPGSGYNDTGDGIYIETNYGYDISLEVYGGTISAYKTDEGAQALRVYYADADNVSVKVYGGTFNTDINLEYMVEAPTAEADENEADAPQTDETNTEQPAESSGETVTDNGETVTEENTDENTTA